jgi:plasmid segregation protein ParM
MKVYIDDGSTNVKLAWFEAGELCTRLSPNSFKSGWSVDAFDGRKSHNYHIDGRQFTFAPTDHRVLKTTNLHFQYDTLNALAIHHALECAGFVAGHYDVVVTLPVSEYYGADNQKNKENIQRKIANISRTVFVGDEVKFIFDNIQVLPESMPAVIQQLQRDDVQDTETSLVIDLGGTTLDCGVITGQFLGIVSVHGSADIGVSLVTEKVKSALSIAHSDTSDYVANLVIQNHKNEEFLQRVVNDKSQISAVKASITEGVKQLSALVVSDIERYRNVNRVYLVGGGASLVFDAVKKAYAHLGDKVVLLSSPQMALVTAMARLGAA